jgi:ElaB/YqjD/DUF883 family membrane-anchored ribosome-binding protein
MNSSPTVAPTPPEVVRQGLRNLAAGAEANAQAHVITPAFDAARRAGAITSEAIDKTREQLAHQVAQAEQFASQQYDRTAKWVSANPFSALGIGFAAGMVITSIFSRR